MEYSKIEIAALFSIGKFENVIAYLNDVIVWNIIGEQILEGKKAVKENCEQTGAYFKSVQTDFKTDDIIASGDKVIVTGTAEFKRDGKRISFVSACDIYEFNENSEIVRITSYCIPEQTK